MIWISPIGEIKGDCNLSPYRGGRSGEIFDEKCLHRKMRAPLVPRKTVTLHRDLTTIHTTNFTALSGVLQIRQFWASLKKPTTGCFFVLPRGIPSECPPSARRVPVECPSSKKKRARGNNKANQAKFLFLIKLKKPLWYPFSDELIPNIYIWSIEFQADKMEKRIPTYTVISKGVKRV